MTSYSTNGRPWSRPQGDSASASRKCVAPNNKSCVVVVGIIKREAVVESNNKQVISYKRQLVIHPKLQVLVEPLPLGNLGILLWALSATIPPLPVLNQASRVTTTKQEREFCSVLLDCLWTRPPVSQEQERAV